MKIIFIISLLFSFQAIAQNIALQKTKELSVKCKDSLARLTASHYNNLDNLNQSHQAQMMAKNIAFQQLKNRRTNSIDMKAATESYANEISVANTTLEQQKKLLEQEYQSKVKLIQNGNC